MKNIRITLLLTVTIVYILFLSIQSCSLFNSPTSEDEEDKQVQTQIPVDTTLYKLTEDTATHTSGIKATLYMIGSIHIGKRPYKLSSTIEEKFAESDVFVMESLPKSENETITIMFSVANNNQIQNTLDPDADNTLKGLVDRYIDPASNTPNFYDTYLHDFVVGIDALLTQESQNAGGLLIPKVATTEPNYLSSFLEPALLEKSKYYYQYGIDNYFYNKAKTNKTLQELESLDGVLNASFSIDIDEQTLHVINTVKILEELIKDSETEEVVAAYTSNDIETFKNLAYPIPEDDDSTYKELISDRNTEWVTALKELIKNRTTGKDVFFVVVGWAHTITLDENESSTYSFQKLLDDNGFSLEEVSQE